MRQEGSRFRVERAEVCIRRQRLPKDLAASHPIIESSWLYWQEET
jgi:hypothetical protein